METINELLDAVKQKAGVESNNAIAPILGVRRQRVTDYYNGDRTPDNIVCKRIAEYLDRPLTQIIAAVGADSEKDEEKKEEWRSYYTSIGGYAASLLAEFFLLVTLIVTPTPAKAAPLLEIETQHFVLCRLARRKIKEAIEAAARMLSTLVPRFGFSG